MADVRARWSFFYDMDVITVHTSVQHLPLVSQVCGAGDFPRYRAGDFPEEDEHMTFAFPAGYMILPRDKTAIAHFTFNGRLLNLLTIPEVSSAHLSFLRHGPKAFADANEPFAALAEHYIKQLSGTMPKAIAAVLMPKAIAAVLQHSECSARVKDALQNAVRISKLLEEHGVTKLPDGHKWRMKLHIPEGHSKQAISDLRGIVRNIERGGLGMHDDLLHLFSAVLSQSTSIVPFVPRESFADFLHHASREIKMAELECSNAETDALRAADASLDLADWGILSSRRNSDGVDVVDAGPLKAIPIMQVDTAQLGLLSAPQWGLLPHLQLCMSAPDEVKECVSDLIYQVEHAHFMDDHTNALRVSYAPSLPLAAMDNELGGADADCASSYLGSDDTREDESDNGSDLAGFIVAADSNDEDEIEYDASAIELRQEFKRQCRNACGW